MICPQCGSPCHDVAGAPRSLVHQITDIAAAILDAPANEAFVIERAGAIQSIVASALAGESDGAGNSDSPTAVRVEDPLDFSDVDAAQRFASGLDLIAALGALVAESEAREDALDHLGAEQRATSKRLRVVKEAVRVREAVP